MNVELDPEDIEKIESLRVALGAQSKAQIIRAGILLLEKNLMQEEKIKRRQHAAKLVAENSWEVYKDFRGY